MKLERGVLLAQLVLLVWLEMMDHPDPRDNKAQWDLLEYLECRV